MLNDKLALHGGAKTVTLPVNDPWPRLGEPEIEAVVALMRSGQISIGDGGGPIAEFEELFARYTGAKYALMHNNGTAALHAGLYAIGVKPGDEVILPAYTWHASAGAIVTANAVPIFCESLPQTLNIDPQDVARKITPRTRAIMVVHLWGNVADMDAIMALAEKHKLAVIEDCSHAHGANWRGRQVGTIGDVGCFSLQGSKVLVAGEGGILITNNPDYYDRAMVLGNHGRITRQIHSDSLRPYTTGFGFKYRPHPVAATIAVEQLKQLDYFNAIRKTNYDYLMQGLANLSGLSLIETLPHSKRGGYYSIRLLYNHQQLENVSRDTFLKALQAEGVQCDTERYELLHLVPFFRERQEAYEAYCAIAVSPAADLPPYQPGDLPITEELHQRLIALPIFTSPCFDLLDQYIAAFGKVIENISALKAELVA